MGLYLQATPAIDADHEKIIEAAQRLTARLPHRSLSSFTAERSRETISVALPWSKMSLI